MAGDTAGTSLHRLSSLQHRIYTSVVLPSYIFCLVTEACIVSNLHKVVTWKRMVFCEDRNWSSARMTCLPGESAQSVFQVHFQLLLSRKFSLNY